MVPDGNSRLFSVSEKGVNGGLVVVAGFFTGKSSQIQEKK